MKLNTIVKYLTVTAICLVSLCACNDIKDDDRFIQLPAIEAKRVVLMEEFTGQTCVNCPEAHQIITELLNTYPDNLISVSIHGGGDAFSISEKSDEWPAGMGLRNEDGQAYCDAYKVPSLPAAVVNRASGVLKKDEWAAAIRKEVEKPSNIDINLAAELNADKNKINITAELHPYDNIKGHLQLWVVESGIVSVQQFPSTYDFEYVHNHVFRGVVNGHDGEAVSLTTRQPATYSYQIDVRNDEYASWKAENLSIVAFVYDSKGVLQAAQVHL